jgi:hypothetical protein
MQHVLDTITEKGFHQPIVSGGNSPSWLLGHLADTDDALFEVLGIRQRMFPDLARIYHHERGTNQAGHLTIKELSGQWKIIIEELNRTLKSYSEQDWLSRHTVVSEEDFKKEPHRNKLNVILTRLTHKASHLGQIALQVK